MFKQDITTDYNLQDATFEIVIMLLIAFFLGFLLRYFMAPVTKITEHTDEALNLLNQLGKTQTELENCIQEKSNLKKNLTLEYASQIEELKEKLAKTRRDWEESLAQKSNIEELVSNEPKKTKLSSNNDLRIIEGIGPALAKLLNSKGIETFDQLSNKTELELKEILISAGSRYKVHDPSTWPEQARLAANENWDELKLLQKKLNSN